MAVVIRTSDPEMTTLDDPCRITSSLSSFERFMIITEDRNLVRLLLGYCDPQTIIRVGMCNRRLYCAVKFYMTEVWNPREFLRLYLWRVSELLALLGATRAIVFGPSVLQFFDRVISHTTPLDICVGYAGVDRLVEYLEGEGYHFKSRPGEPQHFRAALVTALSSFPQKKLTVDGERNSGQHDMDAKVFTFQRTTSGTDESEKVNLHITRCDPFRHLLALESCVLYITFLLYLRN